MHINHLIWDHIFTDLEFGGLVYIKFDRFGKLCNPTDEIRLYDNHIEKLYDLSYKCNAQQYSETECRGIRVNVEPRVSISTTSPPSLKVLSILSIAHTWTEELNLVTTELYNEINKKAEYNPEHDSYAIDTHLQHLSRDVWDTVFQFRIDFKCLDEKKYFQFGPNPFSDTCCVFEYLFRELYTYGYHHSLDALKRLSVYIERAWNLIIKILQMHHDLVPLLPKNPVRPLYHCIHGELQARIHTRARYLPI